MSIGVLKIHLRLPENTSLKGKRRIIRPILERVRDRYNVAIAEIGDQELWQLATLGVSCISNSGQHIDEALSKVVNFIANSRFDVELLDYEIEVLPGP